MIKLILICGKKRSGKDTIADYLHEQFGYKNMKISAPIKSICKLLFGFSDDQMESDDKEKADPNWNISPRQAFQFIGTDMMQYKIQELLPNIGKLFWIKSFIDRIKNMTLPVVVSDVRFLHEYEELKKVSNVIVIRVERDTSYDDSHISEREYLEIPYDILIKNNSTISDLHNELYTKIIKLHKSSSMTNVVKLSNQT